MCSFVSDPNAMTTVLKERATGSLRYILDSLQVAFFNPTVHTYLKESDLVLNCLIAADFEKFLETGNNFYIRHLPLPIRVYLFGKSQMTALLLQEFQDYYRNVMCGDIDMPEATSILGHYWRERRAASRAHTMQIDEEEKERADEEALSGKERTRKGMFFIHASCARV